MFLSYKHNFKQKAIQIQAQLRFVFPQRPSKIAIQKKNVLKYQNYGTCLNFKKARSGAVVKVRTEYITVVQQSLEMINAQQINRLVSI